jgi:hypothetical protein
MLRRTKIASVLAAVALASGVALAPAAHANQVGFNVSIGGPGYGVTVGNAPYWGGGGYYRHYYPYRAYYPAPVYVAPPVVYPRVVYPAPYYYRPYGRVYYRHW